LRRQAQKGACAMPKKTTTAVRPPVLAPISRAPIDPDGGGDVLVLSRETATQDEDAKNQKDQTEEEHDREAAEVIVTDVRETCEVWCDPHGEVWADVEIRGRQETVGIRSRSFVRWLRSTLRERGYPPQKKAAINLAIDELDSWGAMSGARCTQHLRVAHHDGRVYIDLADEQGRVVEVARSGWDVLEQEAPVRFGRGPTTMPLPVPLRGGSVDELRPLVNATDDDHWMLMVGFLVGCFGRGPFPLLCLQGEGGRGKSTTMETLRTMVDPDRICRASRPNSVRDLMVAGQKRWVLSYDNLSGLSAAMSDAFCVLATGGASSERKYYTNSDEVVHERMAPAMCSGIDDIATRGDLVRRSITLDLPKLTNVVPEAVLWECIREAAPRVLGVLLDAVQCALQDIDATPRSSSVVSMADHVAWVEAAASALGWHPGAYSAAYLAMQQGLHEREVERDPVASAIQQYVIREGELGGTTSKIMDLLADDRFVSKGVRGSKAWPKEPRGFSEAIRRIAPALRAVGIEVEQGGPGRQRRHWYVRRM